MKAKINKFSIHRFTTVLDHGLHGLLEQALGVLHSPFARLAPHPNFSFATLQKNFVYP